MTREQLDQLCINTIRTLSMDAVQQANSGHPGTPMALAPVVYCLWQRFLRLPPSHARESRSEDCGRRESWLRHRLPLQTSVINVTLFFSQTFYEQVVEAYVAGLETFVAGNGDLSRIASVASFFISRIGRYPNMLMATTEPAYSLTIFNTSAGEYGVRVGVVWVLIGFVLVIAYQGDAHR